MAMVRIVFDKFRLALQILVFSFVITSCVFSQEKKPDDRVASNSSSVSAAVGQDHDNTDAAAPNTYDIKSEGKSFLKDILKDQKAIYTSPAHIKKKDLAYLVPIGIGVAALLATDRQYMIEINEHPGRSGTRFSYHVGQASDYPTAIGIVAGLYGFGKITHSDHMTETGKLTAEALIDSTILVEILKVATRRERPSFGGIDPMELDSSRGRFEVGGESFPSGHSIEVWSIVGVLSEQYKDNPWVVYTAYGLASLVSVSRVTSRQHFASDVLVGSTLGYLIGRYVARSHSGGRHPIPTIGPVVNRTTKTYGLNVGINF
jgi:membrane-associated phospholipid phosphatase